MKRLLSILALTLAAPFPAYAQTNWTISEESSPLTGARTIAAVTISRNTIANMLGHAAQASLVVRCGESGVAIFVNWTQVVSYDASNFVGSPKTMAIWRIDDGKVQGNYWDVSSTGTAAGEFRSKNAVKLLSSLAGARKLVVRLTGQQTQDAEFDISGIDQVTARVTAACGVKPKR